MRGFFSNRLNRIGLALVLFGWGPLIAVIVLPDLGLWPDPNPNPMGFRLLFFVTFWPAVYCLAVGTFQTWRDNQ